MKHRDLIRKIEDWYQNSATKVSRPVPRHREIKEHLARHILRMLADKP